MPTPFPDLAAVLFDLDGTLIQTRIDFPRMKAGILSLVEAAGFDPAPYQPRDVLSILAEVAPQVAQRERFLQAAEAWLVEVELAGCEAACEMPGATETLRWLLDHGLRVGIVTRNSPQAVEHLFREFSLPHDVLLTRADTPRVKPDPIHLHLALDHLGVLPSRALMVGDHVMDVQGGKAAGTRTLGFLTEERSPDFFREVAPDGVIRALPELRAWISP